MKKNKKGIISPSLFLIGILIVALFGLSWKMLDDRDERDTLQQLTLQAELEKEEAKLVGDSISTCTGGNTQSMLIKAVNEDTASANTDKYSYRVIGDTAWTEATFGTAVTAGISLGADYEFVSGISPTSETGDANGPYFTVKNMPCRLLKEVIVTDDTLYSDMTATFYNSDENAAAQDFDADTSADWVSIKWQAAADEEAGNKFIVDAVTLIDNGQHRKKYPNIVCVNLNTTHHDRPEAKFEGVAMNSVSQPTIHAATAGHTSYCFESPVYDEDPAKYYIKLDPDNTHYASADMDATASLYYGHFYIDSETAKLKWGVVTDDDNFVGFTAAETVTLDLT